MSQHDDDSIHDLFRGLSLDANAPPEARTPFKFLDAYGLEDRDLFFGRDLEIRELYSKFYTHPLLLIYGESGSGKTSLIQCGLQAEIPQEEALFVFVRMATGTPQAVIEKALNKQINQSSQTEELDELLDAVYRQKHKSVMLVLDQFEEFFIFQPPVVRQHFAKQLAQWLQQKSYLRVVISIREEYYAQLSELEKELPTLFDNRLWVRNMSREQAEEVITQPCKQCDIDIESRLSHQLLKDLTQDKKDIDLPILQVVLDSLYHTAKQKQADRLVLSLESYQALGEINKILANFIEQRLKEHQHPELSRQVLKAMISAEGTRKISTLEAIQQRAKSFGTRIPLEALKQQLQQLSDDRILYEDVENGFYELRHDRLAIPIHDWMTGLEKERVAIRQDIDNRYEEYLKRQTLLDADFLKLIAPFADRLHLDEEQKTFLQKSQQHHSDKARRQVLWLITALVAIVVMVSSLWYQAEQAKQRAEKERKLAIDLIDYMNFELHDKLKPLGKLDIMDDVQQHINQFFERIELSDKDKEAFYQKAVGLLRHANTQFAQGKGKAAESMYLQAQHYFKRLTQSDPSNVRWQHALAVSFNKRGKVYHKKGEADKAFTLYQKALQINKTLSANEPSNKQWQYDLSLSFNYLGKLYQAKGELDTALSVYQNALQIRKNLAKTDPNTIKRQRDLSVSLDNVGYLYQLKGDLDQALTLYQQALRISKTLLNSAPNNRRGQRDLSVSLNKVGTIYQAKNAMDKALNAYQEALLIRKKLAKRDPSNVTWQRDLAMNFTQVGHCYQLKDEDDKALNAYQEGLLIMQRLSKNDPSNVLLQRGLSINLSKLGDISVKNKQIEPAKAWYTKALRIVETLATKNPNTIRYALDTAEFYYKLSPLVPQQREQYIQQAEAILQKIAQQGKLTKADQDYFQTMKKALGIGIKTNPSRVYSDSHHSR